ncbi:flavin monoamine oxidase family protein [Streptomyces sp. NPDC002067]
MSKHDVVVVGAGFAGLSAALELHGAGCDVLVLEARGRVGGRALTRFLPDGTQLDLGGQWISTGQHRITELADRYGIATYPTPEYGSAVIDYDGEHRTALPDEVTALLHELDTLCGQVPVKSPWTAADAVLWDRQTFATWLDGTGAPDAAKRYVGRVVSGGLLAGSPAETSLLETLFYLASGGGTRALLGFRGGAQESRVVGGAQEIAERMAADLPDGAVRLSEPVLGVAQDRTGVRVTTALGEHHAARAVIALPPVLAGALRHDPPLSALRAGVFQRMTAGTALKVHAVYAEPFWRDEGLSGVSTSAAGVLTETVDNTPPAAPRAVLTAFVYGDDAARLRTRPPGERRESITRRLGELFTGRAAEPQEFVEFDWLAQEWTRGCFSGHFTPGGWTAFGSALRQPEGALHWAGTETAVHGNGYFEGAVESGRRAAGEALHALGSR